MKRTTKKDVAKKSAMTYPGELRAFNLMKPHCMFGIFVSGKLSLVSVKIWKAEKVRLLQCRSY